MNKIFNQHSGLSQKTRESKNVAKMVIKLLPENLMARMANI